MILLHVVDLVYEFDSPADSGDSRVVGRPMGSSSSSTDDVKDPFVCHRARPNIARPVTQICDVRVDGLSPLSVASFGMPPFYRVFEEPERDAAAPTEALVVRSSIDLLARRRHAAPSPVPLWNMSQCSSRVHVEPP